MKKRTKRLFKVLGVVTALALAVPVLLQTPPGKEMLASALERMLSAPDHLDVRIGKISGWIPASIRVDHLEVSDAEGTWLTAGDLHCRWMLRDLVTGRFRFARLGAGSIELRRLPKGGTADRSSSPKEGSEGGVEVVLDQLTVKQLILGEAVAGLPLEYSVRSGGIQLLPSGRLNGALQVDGDAVGQVELDALLGGGDSRLRILAELERLVNPTFGLDHLSGHAEADISSAGVQARVSAEVRKDDLAGRLVTELKYADSLLQVPGFTIGVGDHVAKGRGQVDFSGEAIDILLDVAGAAGSLHTTASVSTGDGTWAVDFKPLEVRYMSEVTATLEGRVSPEQLSLEGILSDFNLRELPVSGISNFTGRVSGSLALSGSMAEPEARAELDVAQFTSAEEALDELPELEFHVSAALAGGALQGSSVITNVANSRIETGFSMPCGFSLEPLLFRPVVAEAEAELTADVDLGILNYFSLFNDQRMTGRLDAALIYDRHLSGSLRVEQGTYEHFKWGFVVRDIDLDLAAADEGIRIDTATATDGGSGRITMTGGVVTNQLALAVDLSGAAMIRRDEVDATLSGNLEIAGPVSRPEVSGLLTVNRADILIDNMAPALPPLLTSYDALAATGKVEVVKEQSPLPFGLDVKVDLADQVYAVASMIDTIWGGTLQVRDVPEGISVKGVIEPRRGYVSFIGKKFRFVDGQIDLDGSASWMNQLTAEYSRGDFTARLILSGRLDNPDFRLESSPAMPEDEILSYVLFDRDTSSITAYQAFQIAAAARQLSGGLSGPGFMYQMRQAVGVDTLEWREGAEGDASSVAAGKYLTQSLYVEVNRSLDEKGDTGMMAEYEVTRHFSVETSTGPKMRPGIGVNWKNDY